MWAFVDTKHLLRDRSQEVLSSFEPPSPHPDIGLFPKVQRPETLSDANGVQNFNWESEVAICYSDTLLKNKYSLHLNSEHDNR